MMLNNIKSKIITLGTVAAIVAPVLAVIGCSSTSNSPFISEDFRKSLQDHKFTDIDVTYTLKDLKDNGTVYDADMKSWIDGDTPIIENITPKIKGVSTAHIRINAIDTPELHVSDGNGHINVLTEGKEREYAEKAKAFGESQIPNGSHFKLLASGEDSYGRFVGSLFYQADKNQDSNDDGTLYKSYSTRILKEGLCLPFANQKDVGAPGVIDMIAKSLADSYNWAIKNKKGMFSEKVNDILGVHGATDDTAWRWRAERPEDTAANVYEILEAYK